MISFKYRPDVDGLRALAVVMVILFHAGLGFSGGYVGVDVFFVISGFLITGLILKEQGADGFRLSRFWGRRIRRIIPAASVTGVVCLLVGLTMLPGDFVDLAESLIAQQLLVANVYFWKSAGYFAGPAESMPLLHMWSLAVEEQFYLGYPILLILLRRFSPRVAAGVLVGILFASLGIAEWGLRHHPTPTFYLLPPRACELLLGGLLVYCPPPRRLGAVTCEIGAWVGMAMIVGAGVLYNKSTPFPGVMAMIPCVGTFLFIYFNSNHVTRIGKAFSHSTVVFVGLISYSLYLWHWPVLAFARYWAGTELTLSVKLVAVAISIPIAILSWRFVETPFRRGFKSTTTFRLAAGAVVVAALIIGASLAVTSQHGFPSRYSDELVSVIDSGKSRTGPRMNERQIRSGKLPTLGVPLRPDASPDLIVWGDSHGIAALDSFDRAAKDLGLHGVIATRPATVPVLDVWRPNFGHGRDALGWNDRVIEHIKKTKIKNVYLVARWAVNVEGRPGGATDTLIAMRDSASIDATSAAMAFERGLARTLDQLDAIGAQVWILTQVPTQTYDSPTRAIVFGLQAGHGVPPGVHVDEHRDRTRRVNAIIDRLAQGRDRVAVVDLSEPFFERDERSVLGALNESYYADSDHVSRAGARKMLDPLIRESLREISPPNAEPAVSDGAVPELGRSETPAPQ